MTAIGGEGGYDEETPKKGSRHGTATSSKRRRRRQWCTMRTGPASFFFSLHFFSGINKFYRDDRNGMIGNAQTMTAMPHRCEQLLMVEMGSTEEG
jgi:hypothetical protein